MLCSYLLLSWRPFNWLFLLAHFGLHLLLFCGARLLENTLLPGETGFLSCGNCSTIQNKVKGTLTLIFHLLFWLSWTMVHFSVALSFPLPVLRVACCALLHGIYKHGLFSAFSVLSWGDLLESCAVILPVEGVWRWWVSGCKQSAGILMLLTVWKKMWQSYVCRRGFWGRDWSCCRCCHIHRVWTSCAKALQILHQMQKLSHVFITSLVCTWDCCNKWWRFHRGQFLLAGISFLFVMHDKSPAIYK